MESSSKIRPGRPAGTAFSACLAAALLLLHPAGGASSQKKGSVSQEDYVSESLTMRRARDEEFRSRKWTPLAVVAITPLDKEKTTIGSNPDADMRLESKDVADIHAEVLKEPDAAGKTTIHLHAAGGKVLTDSEPPEPVQDLVLAPGARVRIGHFLVYWDNLGTFGAVLRALDFTSTPYTHFDGLRYFPPDPKYRIHATVFAYPKARKVTIVDSHGWRRPAWRYGEVGFKIKGQELRLVLIVFSPKPGPDETFFIAFTDLTRGKETYPAGRYLQPKFVHSGSIVLDFNLAQNPLCAYNLGFACPLAPRENHLQIAIPAGEKRYPHAPAH